MYKTLLFLSMFSSGCMFDAMGGGGSGRAVVEIYRDRNGDECNYETDYSTIGCDCPGGFTFVGWSNSATAVCLEE